MTKQHGLNRRETQRISVGGCPRLVLPLGPRNAPRYHVSKIASYSHEGKQYLTLTLDLGSDGMRLQTDHRLRQDKPIEIQLVLGRKSIHLKGRVVFTRLLSKGQMVSDIQFINLSKNDKKLLKDYLSTVDL